MASGRHRMLWGCGLAVAALTGWRGLPAPAQRGAKAAPAAVNIAFQQFKLDNGLRLVLAEDHTAPVYSLCVTYDVGSRDERPGRTGFAHLFEHMMFQGSENVGKGEHISLIENNGGTFNGTTNQDRTMYFETLPANQLALGLYLEADRMRALDISQANLDNQRATVQEERRQSYDNQAFGRTGEVLYGLAYDIPAYQHSTIGSMEDLNAASVADVTAFFKTYYAPNNAVLALVGDFNAAEARALIQRDFGAIPAQPPPPRPDMNQPPQTAERRKTIGDPFAQTSELDIAYHVPAGNTADWYALSLLGDILAGTGGGGRGGRDGANISRLGHDLVDTRQWAASVRAVPADTRGPSLFQITAALRPGKNMADLEQAVEADLAAVGADGVSAEELQRAQIGREVAGVRALQSSLMRAENLAAYTVFFGDPNLINTRIGKYRAVTAADVQRVAKQYFTAANRTVVITVPQAPAPAAEY